MATRKFPCCLFVTGRRLYLAALQIFDVREYKRYSFRCPEAIDDTIDKSTRQLGTCATHRTRHPLDWRRLSGLCPDSPPFGWLPGFPVPLSAGLQGYSIL
jgi:hypothetical protein